MPIPPGTINGFDTMLYANSADFLSPGSPNYNYHLRMNSAATDQSAGSTMLNDIDLQSRPYNGISDFGADEYWPFDLSVTPGNGTLSLNWAAGASVLADGMNHYTIIVTCEPGANPPQEGNCEEPINVGALTSFTLTGLSSHKQYTVLVNAYDSLDFLIGTSMRVTTSLSSMFLYLPLIIR
jgi:hypothetical protein